MCYFPNGHGLSISSGVQAFWHIWFTQWWFEQLFRMCLWNLAISSSSIKLCKCFRITDGEAWCLFYVSYLFAENISSYFSKGRYERPWVNREWKNQKTGKAQSRRIEIFAFKLLWWVCVCGSVFLWLTNKSLPLGHFGHKSYNFIQIRVWVRFTWSGHLRAVDISQKISLVRFQYLTVLASSWKRIGWFHDQF